MATEAEVFKALRESELVPRASQGQMRVIMNELLDAILADLESKSGTLDNVEAGAEYGIAIAAIGKVGAWQSSGVSSIDAVIENAATAFGARPSKGPTKAEVKDAIYFRLQEFFIGLGTEEGIFFDEEIEGEEQEELELAFSKAVDALYDQFGVDVVTGEILPIEIVDASLVGNTNALIDSLALGNQAVTDFRSDTFENSVTTLKAEAESIARQIANDSGVLFQGGFEPLDIERWVGKMANEVESLFRNGVTVDPAEYITNGFTGFVAASAASKIGTESDPLLQSFLTTAQQAASSLGLSREDAAQFVLAAKDKYLEGLTGGQPIASKDFSAVLGELSTKVKEEQEALEFAEGAQAAIEGTNIPSFTPPLPPGAPGEGVPGVPGGPPSPTSATIIPPGSQTAKFLEASAVGLTPDQLISQQANLEEGNLFGNDFQSFIQGEDADFANFLIGEQKNLATAFQTAEAEKVEQLAEHTSSQARLSAGLGVPTPFIGAGSFAPGSFSDFLGGEQERLRGTFEEQEVEKKRKTRRESETFQTTRVVR